MAKCNQLTPLPFKGLNNQKQLFAWEQESKLNKEQFWLTFDHTDVIGAVSNGQRDSVDVDFDTADNHRFLQRRETTADDSATQTCHFQEQSLVFHTAKHVHLSVATSQHTTSNVSDVSTAEWSKIKWELNSNAWF